MDWHSRIRAALSIGAAPDDDIVEELAQHAQAMYEAARADGSTPAEADRRVFAQVQRWCADPQGLRRSSRRPPLVVPPAVEKTTRFAGLWHDVRYAVRLLRRQRRYAALVSVTLALGIGATTLLFGVTYGVLMRPLPWPNASRLVLLEETRGGHRPRFGTFSNAAFHAWRDRPSTIDEIAAWSQRTVTLAGAGDPERIRITASSASLFRALGARPLVGSLFGDADETAPIVVLSEGLWRQTFGADPLVVGRLVRLDGQPHRVAGVLPERFSYPDRLAQAWVPFRVPQPAGNSLSMFNAVASLRDGASPAQAAAEGTARGRTAADSGMTTMAIFGGGGPIEVSATPLRDALAADVRRPLIVLLIAVGLLLVTATANVASLQLARATSRGREMAIRAALGAGTRRLARQLLVESLLLGLTGGAGGLLIAWLGQRALPSVLPADFPRATDLRLDWVIVLFAFLISLVTSVVLGLVPALRARRLEVTATLAEDGVSPMGAGRRSRVGQARMLIMAAQVAIACVLLVGASLFGRSFAAMMSADRGYDPSGVLTARLSMPSSLFTPERRYAVVDGILERLAHLPAASAVAFTSELPLTPGGSTSAFTLRARDGVTAQASPRVVSPRYFSTMRMRILEGRGFADADTDAAPAAIVVNRAFARRYLGDNPLGAKLPMGLGYQSDETDATVVGVVDDVRYVTGAAAALPEMYYSFRQFKGRLAVPVVTLLVRTDGDPRALGPAVRAAVREADPSLVPESVLRLEDRMLTSIARPRLYAILLAGFAFAALAVAAVGLFGVLSYSVAQRSRELAVRVALGARPAAIVRLVLGHTLAVTSVGLAIGLFASFLLARSVGSLLYGITAYDGIAYARAVAVLLAVAAAACVGPARRAAHLDPNRMLRM